MEFNRRATDEKPLTLMPNSSNFSSTTSEQAPKVGYTGSESTKSSYLGFDMGCMGLATSGPEPESGYSGFDMRCKGLATSGLDMGSLRSLAIWRELQKEKIREEIIAEERRTLEAEVRRELMIERGFQLQRTAELRGSVAKPASGINNEKEINSLSISPELIKKCQVMDLNGVLQATPKAEVSGSKRKSGTPPGMGIDELPSTGSSNKKIKKWDCATCEVSLTSERQINEHLQGKKHKAKAAAKKGKSFEIGLFPEKTDKLDTTLGESLQYSDVKHAPSGDNEKEKYKFWCETCQVGTLSENMMEVHRTGKKHRARLRKANLEGGAVPSPLIEPAAQALTDAGEDGKDGQKVVSVSVNGVIDGVEPEDQLTKEEVAHDGD